MILFVDRFGKLDPKNQCFDFLIYCNGSIYTFDLTVSKVTTNKNEKGMYEEKIRNAMKLIKKIFNYYYGREMVGKEPKIHSFTHYILSIGGE